jgi:hypothetical protein
MSRRSAVCGVMTDQPVRAAAAAARCRVHQMVAAGRYGTTTTGTVPDTSYPGYGDKKKRCKMQDNEEQTLGSYSTVASPAGGCKV